MLQDAEKREFIDLRRVIISAHYQTLNPPQREAVMTTTGPLLLLAGAGSGKTTVLIERIANLINFGQGSDSEEVDDHVTSEDLAVMKAFVAGDGTCGQRATQLSVFRPARPWDILAITFTNKAAGELKERLEKKLGPTAQDVWASTFHSCCVRILRRDIEKMGGTKNFTIYDSADSLSVIKTCLKELDLSDKEFAPRSVLSAISKAKYTMLMASEYAKEAERSKDYFAGVVAKIYKKYEKKLLDAGALDFDDIIFHTVRLLEEVPEVLEYYQKKFHYVLIDEYQDTNMLQYRFASLLAGGYQNFCVVGDDDQSIYRFRGATIENILNFENQYAKAKVIRLEENYRSTQTILDGSNAVIGNNRNRKGKKLWTQAEQGEPITVYQADNESEEAQYVVARMMENYGKGMQWKDHAILYRTNAQSNQLESACKRNGVPYRIVGGIRFFDRAEVKDMLAYLTVLSNPEDDLRLMRIVNNPPRGLGAKTIDTAMEIALREDTCLFAVLDNASMYPELQRSAAKLGEFTKLIGDLATMVEFAPLSDFYETLLDRSGYIKMLEEKNTEENKVRKENALELMSSIKDYESQADEENPATLEGFLDEIALFTTLDTHDATQDFVTMMTMHSAKGLEFPVVFIPGMEEGMFPGYRAVGEEAEMEEERRLCYVGMTRAKKKLYLASASQRMIFGRTSNNKPSRFIGEIPEELLEKVGGARTYTSKQEPAPVQPTTSYHTPSFGGSKTSTTGKSATGATGAKGVGGSTSAGAAPPAPMESYKTGDLVTHKAFGDGTIVSVTAKGKDALLEIEFEKVGTKNLMAKIARSYLSKRGE